MLTAQQQAAFDRSGILKLEPAFTEADAIRMRDVVWHELRRRHGIERDDPSTWNRHPPTGLKSSKKHPAFEPILGAVVSRTLDDLLGSGQWVMPKHFGQVLVTMPGAGPWRVPHRLWHADFGYHFPPGALFAVKCWTLFGDVGPGGGGTPQLAGSHRLVARYIEGRPPDQLEYKRVRDGFMRSHPWLKALTSADDEPDRNARFMDAEADLDGLPARVVELTGSPGDVYVTHPWVMHTIAPNTGDQPRLMRSMAIWRSDFSPRRPAAVPGC